MLYELIRALLAAALVALLPGWFWTRVLIPSSSSSSSDLYERLTYSLALSLALVPAIALIPTRLFGMGVSLSVTLVCVGVVFFSGLGASLWFGSGKGSSSEEVVGSSPHMLSILTLGLLAAAFGLGLGVVAGVVPGLQIRPPVTVGLAPSMGVVFAIALLVFFAGLVFLVESRPEPQDWPVGPRRPPVVLAQRLLLPAVLVLALLRGYLGPALHDWPFIRGVDHYSHAVMANLMMSEGKIEPYLIYPPGFHTMTAEVSRLSGLDPLDVFAVLGPALLLLPALSCYVLGRRLWGREYGVVAAFFCGVLVGGTYHYFNDAMYPNLVASQFLLVLAIAALVEVYSVPSIRAGSLLAILGFSVVLYHQVSSLYLVLLLALVTLCLLPYLLARERRTGIVLLASLALLGALSIFYAWDTYNLPQVVAGLRGDSATSSTGAAVNMAIGTQVPYDIDYLVGAIVSQPIAWLGLLGAALLVADRRCWASKRRVLAYFTLLLWAVVLFAGSRTPLSGFPQRFGRDLGIPLALLAAFAFITILRVLSERRKPATVLAGTLVVALVGSLISLRAAQSFEQAAGPSPQLMMTRQIAAAGERLREHNDGGNIMVSTHAGHVPSRMMLAMGHYSALQSFPAWRIKSPRDLPPTGPWPLWDVLWVLNHPADERTRRLLKEYDVRYVVLYKDLPTRPKLYYWKPFKTRPELYRVAFENEGVLIVAPRDCVCSSKALPYPHGSAGAKEGEAPVRYRRGSGGHTETLIKEDLFGDDG